MDDANTEAAPAEEKQLTPAQLAEIEENKRPFLDKFGALIYEANERLRHGTTLTQTFVDALTALYDEAEKGGAPGSKLRPAMEERQLTAAELQVRADREARRAQRAKDQQAFDDAKKAELAAADALAKDQLTEEQEVIHG